MKLELPDQRPDRPAPVPPAKGADPHAPGASAAAPQDGLFRNAVIQHRSTRIQGQVMLATPLPLQIILLLITAICVTALVFAIRGSYARSEIVAGWITTEAGIIRVTAPQGGVIENLMVHEGSLVDRSSPIAAFRLTEAETTGEDAGTAMLAGLARETVAAGQQAMANQAKFSSARSALHTQRSMRERELGEGQVRVKLLEDAAKLADAAVDRAEELSTRGFVTRADLEKQRSVAFAAWERVSEAKSGVLGSTRQIADIDAQLLQISAERSHAEAEAASNQASLSQRRISLGLQSAYQSKSPIAGKVVALPVERGQFVLPGGTVAVLAPAEARLIAELYVPTSAAGFVKTGQTVHLMLQAFPYQKFGTAEGRVVSVSRTVLAPNEIATPGIQMKEPVFRARVSIDRPTLRAYGRQLPLQPGMLLDAQIVLDRRSLLEWILDPIYAVTGRE
jgi:membrane fusion protein